MMPTKIFTRCGRPSSGYVMCDEEKQMLDGTYPVYKGKDARRTSDGI